MNQYLGEDMLTLALTGIFYTHMWVNGRNTFVKVCHYRASKETSQYYYDTPKRIWIYDYQYCKKTIKIKK